MKHSRKFKSCVCVCVCARAHAYALLEINLSAYREGSTGFIVMYTTPIYQESELKRSREKAIQFVDSISMNLESNAAR